MLSIRKGLALVLAGSMAVMAGCGGGATDNGTTPTPAPADNTKKDPVAIQFWHGMDPNSAHGKVLADLVDEFNKAQQEVKVEHVYQGNYGQVEQKLMAALTAGNAPAVVQNTDSMLTNLVKNKAVQALDSLIDAKEKADYVPATLKAVTYDGKLMALPFNKSAIVLVYDKSVVKTPPTNWEEFKKTAKEVTTAERYGTAFNADVYYFGTHFGQTGGEWIKDGKAAFNSPEGVAAMNLIVDMVKDKSAIQLKPGEYQSNYFNEGRAAMIATTSASFAFIKPSKDTIKWDVAPLYAGPKGEAVPLSGANVSIIAGIKDDQAKAAAKFITWLTGKDATLKWGVGKTGYAPVRLSALNSDTWKNFVKENPMFGVVGDAITKGVVQPNHPNWQAVQKEITTAVETAILGQADAKAALDAAATKANNVLK